MTCFKAVLNASNNTLLQWDNPYLRNHTKIIFFIFEVICQWFPIIAPQLTFGGYPRPTGILEIPSKNFFNNGLFHTGRLITYSLISLFALYSLVHFFILSGHEIHIIDVSTLNDLESISTILYNQS